MFAQLLGYRFTVLRDGRRVLVRPITPQDKVLLARGIEQLSDESSRRRFLSPKHHFTGGELRYLTEVDHLDHEALVAVLADDPDQLVGVARLVRDREDPEAAEAAFTIGDPFQGQGVGRALALMLADAARDRGIRRITATMLADNRAAFRLFAAMTDDIDVEQHGSELELVAHLHAERAAPPAEVVSLLAARPAVDLPLADAA